MQQVDKDTMKAISSLQMNPSFIRIRDALVKEHSHALKGLLVADRDKIQHLQGRTKILGEILDLIYTK